MGESQYHLHQKQQQRTCHKKMGALMLDKELNGDGRRTDEEAQLGNGAFALRFIWDGKGLDGMKNKQQVNRYRWSIGMNGQANDTRS